MNTVYSYFVEYFHKIKKDTSDPSLVESGIASYLESIGIPAEEQLPDAEKIAERELLRFKLMPEKTFAAFFENYAAREKIVQFVRETELLAVNRSLTDKCISQERYLEKLGAFYSISGELAADKRYTVWVSSALEEITANLKYAAGLADIVPSKIEERVLFYEQKE